jgi:hypothetical protein
LTSTPADVVIGEARGASAPGGVSLRRDGDLLLGPAVLERLDGVLPPFLAGRRIGVDEDAVLQSAAVLQLPDALPKALVPVLAAARVLVAEAELEQEPVPRSLVRGP